ncbi:MAG: CARDB domain-containing protein [Phycisphaerae bacterium]
MRLAVSVSLLLFVSSAWSTDEPVAVMPWFTDAQMVDSVQLPKPAEALPAAPGTVDRGVELRRSIPIENPLLGRAGGCISFWIQPKWGGDDGATHRLLRIGDPSQNGLLVEKAATGMLRFVMASPQKVTASRADVSGWKAGEWHQVAIAWLSKGDAPIGLPLWIDRVAVAGPIAGGNTFLDPDSMADRRVWIGDASSNAVMDELMMRDRLNAEGPEGLRAVVYRDYFRSASYTEIRITPEALCVRSDRRVVAGHEKQFGLLGRLGGEFEYLTDYAVRYGQWGAFDAKPFITWKTADEQIATVDDKGMVTGHAVGTCQLTAEFRGMQATYDIEVIPVEQPDLDLLYVERLPRYKVDSAKNSPSPGDTVESVIHLENFGYETAPAGTVVRLELIPDRNRNFQVDDDERPGMVREQTIDEPLAPRARRTVRFTWDWPAEAVWVRVTLDPEDRIPEICEANNQRCELNITRPMRWGYEPQRLETWYKERRINHVGSFSHFDWLNAQCARFNLMLREAVGPTTTAHGIEDALRSDNFFEILGSKDGEEVKWRDQPWEKARPWYDGGFPVREPVNAMAIDAAILHEFGHTCVSLPDLYGYPVRANNVFLKDEDGNDYAGSPLLPIIRDDILPLASAMDVPCGVSYTPLMHGCHLWLHPAHAGQVHYFAGYRGQRFWGV